MLTTELDVIENLKNSDCHHLSILATNPQTALFKATNGLGQIAYQIQGNYLFTIGGILAKKENKLNVYREFNDFAKGIGKKIVALHSTLDDIAVLQQYNYSINQLGSSYSINLKQFSFKGKKHATMRNKISKARRQGIIVQEITNYQQFLSIKSQLDQIDAEWLSTKGGKALTFMVTNRSIINFPDESYRLFIARQDNRVLAYILYSRSYGEYKGWVHDLSRQRQNAPMGTLPLINIEAMATFINAQDEYLNFGFTPLADLQNESTIETKSSQLFSWISQFLAKYGDVIYPAKGQRQYKMSWRPHIIKPEYIAFEGGFKVSALLAFLQITNSL